MWYKIQNQKLPVCVCGAADSKTDTISDSEQNARSINKTAKQKGTLERVGESGREIGI